MTDEEREFSRRRNLPHVETRIIPSKRSVTVALSLCGREIGQRTDILRRGKVVQSLYVLPEVDNG